MFERYQRGEKALVSALAEVYLQVVSTRKVKAITEEPYGHAFNARTVSQINQKQRHLGAVRARDGSYAPSYLGVLTIRANGLRKNSAGP